ncbi:RES family NAD+ phosphorylase [Streptomyces sp. NPDC093094]|uniref:RES family NAD+ phosphorylase n=1 Tax=Streptomyces sp. NPDC093094 TaxID=3366026 RepID=UPI00381CC093
MPRARPPVALPGTPTRTVLPAGTPLFRIHSAARQATGHRDVPTPCLYGGGRFDATPCHRYGFLYAGLSVPAAVCETLLRSVPFAVDGTPRAVPRAAVRGRRLSFLRLDADVRMVCLVSGRDLAAVAQDSWLVQAEAVDYPYTRDWGHWIREHTESWAQGFVWTSKREPAHRAAVLFDDRPTAPAVAETGQPPVDFDTPQGEQWLNDVLEAYGARLAP